MKYPNVYGIDMPTRSELVAHGRTHEEIAKIIGADKLVYQDVEAMKQAVRDINPALKDFDASCFDGRYVTGDIDEAYLARLETARSQADRDGTGGDTERSALHLQRSSGNE
ncbi:Amidophosphoribosyltransferase [compost metagenome]